MITAHIVDAKGPGDELAVRRIVRDIEEAGCKGCSVRLNTGQYFAMVEIQGAVSEARQGEARQSVTVPINSAAYDWKQNGRVESAIKRLKGQLRTVKSGLETNL